MTDVIILPGINGSGEDHWQTHWERRNPAMRRFRPDDWDRPELGNWIAALERAVEEASEPPLIVAHSLACLLIAPWAARSSQPVRGAFLVSVPDPSGGRFPSEATGFDNQPEGALRFPSLIVASSNDPFGTLDYMEGRARQWGSGFIDAGALGDINAASGLGDWPQGAALFEAFAAGTRQPS
ncbi:RBBP9/YdeN family alpha/beta hydrolase [Microvirga sp. GCM10011540]|uniref:RBBP9/YdeN family alpha/beta hydrolase n=1 Tax=Microvirga sp. GCM10011540 TaxID=3317338 RepID=UPI00360960A0